MQLVAVLDDERRLIGTKNKRAVVKGDVALPVGCDLPLDGTYKWNGSSFIPLGHGFGPVVAKPPYSESAVLFLLVQAMGKKAPHECLAWAEWYAENLKVREDELARRRGKPKIRRGP